MACGILVLWQRNKPASSALQNSSLTILPPRKSQYLPFHMYYMFMIWGAVHSHGDPDFHFLSNSFWLETFYKTFTRLVCWWWCSLVVVVCLRMYFILFWYIFFLGIEFWVNYISLSTLICGASVLWLTLLPMPNLLSFPFFCSTVAVFSSGYNSLIDCFKQWIMMCL